VTYKAEMFGSSVIIVGKFNPPIVSPDWLERNQLFGRDDAESARQGTSFLLSHQASQFETPWCSILVVENQLSVISKGAVTESFKDLAAGICSLLPQTPMDAIGLNFYGHFKMTSTDEYHRVGDFFAPKAIWNSIFSADKFNTGLQDLTMRVARGARNQKPKNNDFKHVTLQPSGQILEGIYLQLNDNHDLTKAEASDARTASERAAEVVDMQWSDVRRQAEELFDELLRRATAKDGSR
jgi:hypothetical protein